MEHRGIHDFSGSVKISIQLTDEQIAEMGKVDKYDIYYYNESTHSFTPMNATYDPATKSMILNTVRHLCNRTESFRKPGNSRQLPILWMDHF